MAKGESKKLNKRLAAYSVAAAAALTVAPAAKAAVQYSGPMSLPVSDGSSQFIDMNGDANFDFIFNGYYTTTSVAVPPFGGPNQIAIPYSTYYSVNMLHATSGSRHINESFHNDPANLPTSYSIKSTLSGSNYWATYAFDTLTGKYYSQGNFNDTSGYIGVRFWDNNRECAQYGWIAFTGTGHGTGTIDGWAYDDTCDTPIKAGDIGCTDGDADGVCDSADNCPAVFNPSQTDTDTDGVGDACDVCPTVYDDGVTDSDADGFGDACDVCPSVYDPAQTDTDVDGVGDACDVCPGFDDNIDTDADTVPDGCDVCPGYDDTIDTDGDLTPDGCDLDDDGDGIADTIEDAAPNGGDGNYDGIPDSLQSDVTSLPAALGGGYVTIDTNTVNCPITNVSTVDETALPFPDPSNRIYPYGLVQFTAGCSSANVETIWSSGLAGMFPRKTNQTLGTWFDMGSILGDTMSMTINDGGAEDNDNSVNVAIVDPQGPAGALMPLPTMGEWGMILLAGLLSALAIRAINREQEEA